jgi:hypothetical protein
VGTKFSEQNTASIFKFEANPVGKVANQTGAGQETEDGGYERPVRVMNWGTKEEGRKMGQWEQ